MERINVGDKVTPKSPGGLQLADRPTNGEYEQYREVICVIKGEGIVMEVEDIVIDYDSWPDTYVDSLLGKIDYRCCKVKCEAGIGWAGEGALIKL